jgi:hypothetical protein
LQAQLLGKVMALTPGETRLAGSINAMPNVVGRTWEYWSCRLAESGRLPPRRRAGKAKSPPVPRSASGRAGKRARS